MRKKGVFVAFFIVMLVPFILGQGNGKADDAVYSKIEKEGKAKVFIKFREVDERGLFSRERKGLMEEISEHIGEDKVRFKFKDSISANVDLKDIEKLERNLNIESIELVGYREVFLQDSILQTNASKSHNLKVNGINLTGEGRSICIIDTGVNYTHPDLGGCYGDNNLSSNCKVWGGHDYCSDDASCSNSDNDPIDVEGHGTHVSGIAAANGSINGIAKGSRIIIIKACNSSGSCFDDAIKSGINWCVNNATKFNISVISMSLGGGLFSDFCNSDPLASNINDAVGNNIPVVVASGNSGSTTEISAPSCVQNATPIGSIRKDDSTFDFNRNSLVKLVAPGVSINSTYLSSSGYSSQSGTSMSTPHVAGAVSILSQYLNLTGRLKTPLEVETIFNNTGKIVYDSGSSLNYSRIDIYSAVISQDESSPNVTLDSPANGTLSSSTNQTFICNATDLALKNATFYLWNSSSEIYNESFRNVSGGSYNFEINITGLDIDEYKWNCLFVDENNNREFAESNFTITIKQDLVSLLSPDDGLATNLNQSYSCTGNFTNNLDNATFYIWNSSGLESIIVKNISGLNNNTNFNFNFSHEDSYEWNCLFSDNSSTELFADSNYSIIYDFTAPEINITSPLNGSWHNSGRFNVTLGENGTCLYSLDFGAVNISMNSSNNRDFHETNLSIAEGNYSVAYYCNDTIGNLNSEISEFNIDLTKPNVSLSSPDDGHSVTGAQEILFIYNVTENSNLINRCSLILNNEVSAQNSSSIIFNSTNNISYSVEVGSYNWRVNCTDIAGNAGNSSLRSLTVNSPPSTEDSDSGDGGDDGGGSILSIPKIYKPDEIEVSSGYTKELEKGDKIVFNISNGKEKKHNITIDFVGKNFVNLTIRSSPKKIVLTVGQSAKLNLTSPDYYDLYIGIEDIIGKKVNLTVQVINEFIPGKETESDKNLNTTKNISVEEKEEEPFFNFWVVLVLTGFLAALFFAFGFLIKFLEKKKKRGKKERQVKIFSG